MNSFDSLATNQPNIVLSSRLFSRFFVCFCGPALPEQITSRAAARILMTPAERDAG